MIRYMWYTAVYDGIPLCGPSVVLQWVLLWAFCVFVFVHSVGSSVWPSFEHFVSFVSILLIHLCAFCWASCRPSVRHSVGLLLVLCMPFVGLMKSCGVLICGLLWDICCHSVGHSMRLLWEVPWSSFVYSCGYIFSFYWNFKMPFL